MVPGNALTIIRMSKSPLSSCHCQLSIPAASRGLLSSASSSYKYTTKTSICFKTNHRPYCRILLQNSRIVRVQKETALPRNKLLSLSAPSAIPSFSRRSPFVYLRAIPTSQLALCVSFAGKKMRQDLHPDPFSVKGQVWANTIRFVLS